MTSYKQPETSYQQPETSYRNETAPLLPKFFPQDAENVNGHSTNETSQLSPEQPDYGSLYIPAQNNVYYEPYDIIFSDKNIRRPFLGKVYSIVTCQLLVMLICVTFTILYVPTERFIREHPIFSAAAISIVLGFFIFLTCCEQLRRQIPTNLIVLFVFTFAESFLIAVSVSLFFPEEVLMALGLATLVCFALTLFVVQKKIEYTPASGFFMVATIVIIVLIIATLFFPEQFVTLLIVSVVTILFSMYLIYDTQMMMKGNHIFSVSPKEYIFAALNVNVFLFLLSKMM